MPWATFCASLGIVAPTEVAQFGEGGSVASGEPGASALQKHVDWRLGHPDKAPRAQGCWNLRTSACLCPFPSTEACVIAAGWDAAETRLTAPADFVRTSLTKKR